MLVRDSAANPNPKLAANAAKITSIGRTISPRTRCARRIAAHACRASTRVELGTAASAKIARTASTKLAALGITCPAFRCGAVQARARRKIPLNHNALRTALVRSERTLHASSRRRMAENIHQLMRPFRLLDVDTAGTSSANDA